MDIAQIFIMVLFFQTNGGTDPLEIQPVNTESGIYYEEIGKAGLYSSEWIIVTYYDLRDLRTEFETIIELTNQIRKICNDLKPFETICNGTVTHLNYLETQIAEKNSLILPRKRTERALISLIGKIGKPLFGILNEDDAMEYDRKIEQLTSNQETLLNIMKNQTVMIDLTVNIFNKTREEISRNFEIISHKINELGQKIDSIEQLADVLYSTTQFESIVSLIVLIMMRFHTLQTELLDLLVNSQHGNFQASLFTPRQIESLFTAIRKELPNNYKLPFDSADNLSLQLHKMSSTTATVLNDKIILEIKFPLPLKETYQLYRIHPFPTIINNSLCHIQPSSELFLIDINREHYYHLSSENLQHCIKKDDAQYYCKMISPLYNANLDLSSCESSLIRQETIREQCQTHCTEKNYYFTTLSQPNTWLFTSKSLLQIDVICKEAIQAYTLQKSGLMRLKPGCYIRSKHFILYGQNYKLSEMKGHFSPLWNLSSIIESRQDSPLYRNITNTVHRLDEHHEELAKIQEVLKSQKEQENKISLKIAPHHLHHYAMTYILIALVIGVIIWYFCHSKKQKIASENNEQTIELQVPNPRWAFYEVDPPSQLNKTEKTQNIG